MLEHLVYWKNNKRQLGTNSAKESKFFGTIVLLHRLVILTAALAACAADDGITWINRNQTFVLNSRDLAKLEQKGRNGDGKAAFEVFLHYSWGLHDKRSGEPWLRLAREVGSSDANNYLAQLKIAQPSDYQRFMKGKALP